MKALNIIMINYIIAFSTLSFFSSCAHAVDIDGKLDDAIWNDVLSETTNYEVSPQTLNKINNNFSYKIVTAKTGLYIGLTANKSKPLRLRTQENDAEFSNHAGYE
ncbi:hypothetical protein ACPUVO_16285 [Pseudocolwellia sp. HL-MZ19]|uniref:hypothetical protein n=1 Tax=unclassified Pseudocolwellia TaxID=2848178 RepID=UPI003CFA0C33